MKGLALEGSQTCYQAPFPTPSQSPPMCVRYAGQCNRVTYRGHAQAEPTRVGLPAARPLLGVGSPSPDPHRLGEGQGSRVSSLCLIACL